MIINVFTQQLFSPKYSLESRFQENKFPRHGWFLLSLSPVPGRLRDQVVMPHFPRGDLYGRLGNSPPDTRVSRSVPRCCGTSVWLRLWLNVDVVALSFSPVLPLLELRSVWPEKIRSPCMACGG